MSAVLKKLSLIQPFHRKAGWTSQKHKQSKEERKSKKRTTFQVDLGAPNNSEEYVKKIEDRIILKLVAPELSAFAETIIEGEKEDCKTTKPAVEHIEDKNEDKKEEKIGKHVSKRLNEDRIKKMIQLDELYFKDSEEQIGMCCFLFCLTALKSLVFVALSPGCPARPGTPPDSFWAGCPLPFLPGVREGPGSKRPVAVAFSGGVNPLTEQVY